MLPTAYIIFFIVCYVILSIAHNEQKIDINTSVEGSSKLEPLYIRACYGQELGNCDYYGNIMMDSETYKILKDDFCLIARKRFQTLKGILVSVDNAIIKNTKITNYKFIVKTAFDLQKSIDDYKQEWEKCKMLQICIPREDVYSLKTQ